MNLSRASLKRLIERSETLELVGEAADGESALTLARQVGPDVVFLDIRMPGKSGLEVARELDTSTRIIFTTAYDEFAVTAFELQALDYLLKPFGPRRFKRDRLKGRWKRELFENGSSRCARGCSMPMIREPFTAT